MIIQSLIRAQALLNKQSLFATHDFHKPRSSFVRHVMIEKYRASRPQELGLSKFLVPKHPSNSPVAKITDLSSSEELARQDRKGTYLNAIIKLESTES
jgi:hypothetical protein